jgi:Fe-S-cluster containining protein
MKERIQIDIKLRNGSNHTLLLNIPMIKISSDALVQPMHKLFDKIVDWKLSQSPVTCKKGCSKCCNQLIPLSAVEVLYLNRLLASFPKKMQQRIKGKIRRIKRMLRQESMPYLLKDIYSDPGFERTYFELGIPCPFLEKGSCSIYPQRPFVCREYHVCSPPSLCADPFNKKPGRVKIGVNFGSLMAVFCSRLYSIPPLPVPLFHLLDWIKDHKKFPAVKISSQLMFESLLNGLTKFDFKNSFIESMNWKFADNGTLLVNL